MTSLNIHPLVWEYKIHVYTVSGNVVKTNPVGASKLGQIKGLAKSLRKTCNYTLCSIHLLIGVRVNSLIKGTLGRDVGDPYTVNKPEGFARQRRN